jgi:hypothetical protein
VLDPEPAIMQGVVQRRVTGGGGLTPPRRMTAP